MINNSQSLLFDRPMKTETLRKSELLKEQSNSVPKDLQRSIANLGNISPKSGQGNESSREYEEVQLKSLQYEMNIREKKEEIKVCPSNVMDIRNTLNEVIPQFVEYMKNHLPDDFSKCGQSLKYDCYTLFKTLNILLKEKMNSSKRYKVSLSQDQMNLSTLR